MLSSKLIKALLVLAALVLLAFTWLGWPIYGYLAHQGKAPMALWGWQTLGDDAHQTSELFNPDYHSQGTRALEALEEHRLKIGAPAMTAAVAINGEIAWQGASGWADIATRAPATSDTVFRIGSSSKALTATALARLVEAGVIDLDTPIEDYLSKLPNADWARLTPRMLAAHTAGIPHYGDNDDSWGAYQTGALQKAFASPQEALAIFDESTLRFEPGSQFEYSSLGTVLLAAVMSEAAGMPYTDLMAAEVFEPAGATSARPSPKRGRPQENSATFYYRREDQYRPWRAVDLSHRLPGGGWAATSADLARIGSLWLDPQFISPSVREEFWTPQRLSSGEVNEDRYALGWRRRETRIEGFGTVSNANHGGVTRGAQSWLVVYPDHDIVVAFNINSKTEAFRDFRIFSDELFRFFAAQQGTTALD